MKYLIIAAVLCIFVGVSDALWCYKCSGSACLTPDTSVDGVYITECDDYTSLCYKQVMEHAGATIYARGCTQRKSECSNYCYTGSDYKICESCCFANLCNSARNMTPNIVLFAFSITVAFITRLLML